MLVSALTQGMRHKALLCTEPSVWWKDRSCQLLDERCLL